MIFAVLLPLRNQTTTQFFDHVYPGSEKNDLTVILYGLVGSPALNAAHKKMKELTTSKNVKYVFRQFIKVSNSLDR